MKIEDKSTAPKLVVKYFSPNIRQYIENGSLRFGTLEEYRSLEGVGGVMMDGLDGVVQHHTPGGPQQINCELPGLKLVNCVTDGRDRGLLHQTKYNQWVFCAAEPPRGSNGYDRVQHDKILRGAGEGEDRYYPNPTYTEYVVFDFHRLRDVLEALTEENIVSGWSGELKPIITTVSVGYMKRSANLADPTDPYLDIPPELRAVCMKPSSFAPENEVRTILRPSGRGPLAGHREALIVQSSKISDCILQTGTFE